MLPSIFSTYFWDSMFYFPNCVHVHLNFQTINGQKFMTLTKEQIVNLTGMKVGPSLKIYDLIQQLKISVASQRQRQHNVTIQKGTTTVVTIGSPQRAQVVQQVVTQSPPIQSTSLKAQLTTNANTNIPFIAQNS